MMIKYLKIENQWLQILIILSIILLVIYYLNKNKPFKTEGFDQQQSFVMKQNNAIYDIFYVEIYDDLQKSSSRTEFEVTKIIELTQPSKTNSVILDIGSGTGHLVNKLNESGYKTFGIDQSKAMVNYSENKFPNNSNKFSVGDINDPMTYERNSFTHITCMNFTIYHLNDKVAFFKNCYFWLIQNGYLILHLVNRDKYDPIVPAGIPSLLENPQKYSKNRIKNTEIDFKDFTYKNMCNFDNDKQVVIKETFTDSLTQNIRQNELTLYMEDIDEIVKIAQHCKFIPISQINMVNDKNQHIYIFEKIM